MAKRGSREAEAPRRRVHLERLELSFTASAAAPRWQALVDLLRFSRRGKDDETLPTAYFVALPASGKKHYLTGGVHSKNESAVDVHWHLELLRVPGQAPPAKLIEESEAVGGYPGVLTALCKEWPGLTMSYDAEFRARFTWRDDGAPAWKARKMSSDLLRLTETGEFRTWSASASPLGIQHVTVGRAMSTNVLFAEGKTRLDLSATLLTTLEKKLWASLSVVLPEASRSSKK